jgi:DNA repair protein RadC|nr:JAB domain-containing protein [uncultured Prevotella sp.]
MRDNSKKCWYDTTATMIERYGTEYVSNENLIAAVLGIDIMNEVNQPVRDLFDGSHSLRKLAKKKTFDELVKVKGIGEKKAAALLAAFEIGRRLMKEEAEDITDLGSSLFIYNYMRPFTLDLDHEESWVLCMDQNFKLIKRVRISVGGNTETTVDIRLICKEAIMCNATIIALVHNHPSCNTTPSKNDDILTMKIQKACQVMNLFFSDHVIISSKVNTYYSYHDKGKL